MLLFGTTKLFDKDLDLVEKRGKDIQKSNLLSGKRCCPNGCMIIRSKETGRTIGNCT